MSTVTRADDHDVNCPLHPVQNAAGVLAVQRAQNLAGGLLPTNGKADAILAAIAQLIDQALSFSTIPADDKVRDVHVVSEVLTVVASYVDALLDSQERRDQIQKMMEEQMREAMLEQFLQQFGGGNSEGGKPVIN